MKALMFTDNRVLHLTILTPHVVMCGVTVEHCHLAEGSRLHAPNGGTIRCVVVFKDGTLILEPGAVAENLVVRPGETVTVPSPKEVQSVRQNG